MHGDGHGGLDHPGHWLNAVDPYIPDWARAWVDPISLTAWIAIIGIGILAYLGSRRLRQRPTHLQSFWELVVEAVRAFCRDTIGPGGERYATFIGAIMLYVFCNSMLGLVPGFVAPTSSLAITAAPALCVFVYVQYLGIKEQGMGYLKHFVGEFWWMAPVMIPVHLIGEIAKPVSLSIRLFGNVFGKDSLIAQLIVLGALAMRAIYVPVAIQLPMVVFAIFMGGVQAFVFALLTASYISLAITHDEHDEAHPSCETAAGTEGA